MIWLSTYARSTPPPLKKKKKKKKKKTTTPKTRNDKADKIMKFYEFQPFTEEIVQEMGPCWHQRLALSPFKHGFIFLTISSFCRYHLFIIIFSIDFITTLMKHFLIFVARHFVSSLLFFSSCDWMMTHELVLFWVLYYHYCMIQCKNIMLKKMGMQNKNIKKSLSFHLFLILFFSGLECNAHTFYFFHVLVDCL